MRTLLLLLALETVAAARPLERTDVVAGMTAIRPALDACATTHHASGVALVKLTIAPAGTVSAAAIAPRAAGWGDFDADSEVGRCLVAAVRAARFAAFDGPARTIDYPLVVGASRSTGLLLRAQDAYVAGHYDDAIALAQQARDADPHKAWRIIGASSCFLHRAADAASAVRALDEPGGRFVRYVCARNHVTLAE